MDALVGLAGKKHNFRFTRAAGFYNSRILAYFSNRRKTKALPLRHPFDMSDLSQVFRVDDILWVLKGISENHRAYGHGLYPAAAHHHTRLMD